jgi:hypothetical protein
VANLSRDGLHEEHAVATWNLGTLKRRKTKKIMKPKLYRNLIKYLKIQILPRRKHRVSVTKTGRLMILSRVCSVSIDGFSIYGRI